VRNTGLIFYNLSVKQRFAVRMHVKFQIVSNILQKYCGITMKRVKLQRNMYVQLFK